MKVSTNKVMGRGYAIVTVAGVLIGAAFGRVWLSLLANDFPEWPHQIEISGWIVLTLFVFMGVLIMLRIFQTPISWNGQLPIRAWYIWFVVSIIAEIALIGFGNSFLQDNNLVNWKPAWILFIVGIHFFVFAYIFRIRSLNWLAATVCLTSILSVLMSSFFETDYLLYSLTGLSGALSLWSFAAWALFRMAKGKWINVK